MNKIPPRYECLNCTTWHEKTGLRVWKETLLICERCCDGDEWSTLDPFIPDHEQCISEGSGDE